MNLKKRYIGFKSEKFKTPILYYADEFIIILLGS